MYLVAKITICNYLSPVIIRMFEPWQSRTCGTVRVEQCKTHL